MRKERKQTLALNKQTLRALVSTDLRHASGGSVGSQSCERSCLVCDGEPIVLKPQK